VNRGQTTTNATQPTHIDNVDISEIFKKIKGVPYDEEKVAAQFAAIENAVDTPFSQNTSAI